MLFPLSRARALWALAVLVLCAAVASGRALAEEHIWIIGGGPTPEASERQIELNVKWVIDTLRRVRPDARLHVYFGKGQGAGSDVKHWQRPAETAAALQPLARVFGQQMENGNAYRPNTVPDVLGPTTKTSLVAQLGDEFSQLRPGDQAWLIFNGHGLQDAVKPGDPAANTLRLWGNTRLSVRELDTLMGRVDPAVRFRFIFTQCYSGGFLRLIRPQAEDRRELAPADRCGFAAESATRMSEGCSATLKVGDYRDYTTFFFAALGGQTRLGEALPDGVDRNGDGVVSPLEAHRYVLKAAHNADLPRSTSEDYLERWQPWYLRWVETGRSPDNSFSKLAAEIAAQLGLPTEDKAMRRELERRRAGLVRESGALLGERDALVATVRSRQEQFQQQLAARWPQLKHPFTTRYAQFLVSDSDEAQAFIVALPAYDDLVRSQDRLDTIELELVRVDRDETRLGMVLRLRRMARLLGQFERFASARERAEYSRLQDCESAPL